ncbi:hypothetical protein PVAND_006444 [Polypedilum vanderplanki]|uniref:Protein-lysine N-methyltransferase PVAND_006444 n=1 Tax=Polypedilum vanderplanki TaxID=319348 RepID=A0A9J6C434_POLVA|nr:hypothetical protein PVAND_006444 [Polypedilum vanderplanki]
MCDSDDEEIKLSAETQAILNQFLKEKEQQEKSQVVEENWQLSQFWYSEATQKTFGKIMKQLIRDSKMKEDICVALLSCPSLFETINSIADNVRLFEFDERFQKYGKNFVHYDYNLGNDENYLKEYKKTFDLIILDPPFLSEECLRKSFQIVNRIKKDDCKIILNTGIVQKTLAKELGLEKSSYKPQHKNNLGNEFASFANFDLNKYI